MDGYGPVAEIVLAHHERIDGNGYPNGLVGEQIPLAARIIAVADTYDVMTARDSYRRPVSSREAIEELRRVSGSPARRAVVETFIGLLEKRSVTFRHADDADFERELNLDRRIRDYARRASSGLTPRAPQSPRRFPYAGLCTNVNTGWVGRWAGTSVDVGRAAIRRGRRR